MIKGIAFAIGACFIWGLIFVVPQYMSGFSSLEVTVGRYLIYGILSGFIFLKAIWKGGCKYPSAIWLKALYLSSWSSIGYYTFVVLALRYSTPAICALILGISPIAITLYGNWKQKECSYRSLILPSILIVIGLVVINVPNLTANVSPSTYILGLLCGFLALASWSWYVVENSRFLKRHPEVHSSDWSTLIGVTTLFWALLLAIFLGVFFNDQLQIQKYVTFNLELTKFLVGCSVLGLLCSWVGTFLWNKASFYLPVSLVGQLSIFETIFGVLFVYILLGQMPPSMECLGIVFLLGSIVYGIRQATRNPSQQVLHT